jgi:hypothetical protein
MRRKKDYLDNVRMAGESQVVVGAEVQNRLCVSLQGDRRRSFSFRQKATKIIFFQYQLSQLSFIRTEYLNDLYGIA